MEPPETLERPSGPGSPRGGASRYRSQLPHHRRRRRMLAVAITAVALIVLIVVASGGGGRSGPARARTAATPAGFFTRISTLAGSGPGSLGADEQRAENAAIDRTLAYTPYVRVAGTQHREIALTFDDGPGPYTPQVISELQRLRVPATFFEVGVEEHYFHAGTSAIVAAGDPIGDHTQTHPHMGSLSAADQQSQILQQISATGAYGAPYPRMFRPPYGSWDNETLAILRRMRMLMVLWTVDTNDYEQPGVEVIVHSVLSGARPGAIILMHDAGGTRTQTVAALPAVISDLRAKGYSLVTVPKLLLDNPPPANQDIAALGAGG